MSDSHLLECDLLVIGMGMAGMCSSLFAVNRGLRTVQVGFTGGLLFASGLLDLLGVHPTVEAKQWSDPWAAIDALTRDIPNHPYVRLKRKEIEAAFDEVLSFLKDSGLYYNHEGSRNVFMITPLGTTKPTYSVPKSMWAGVRALRKKVPCLIVGFKGLSDFSAYEIVGMLRAEWPRLRACHIPFPKADFISELVAGDIMAQSLELATNRESLAQAVLPHVKDAEAIGMPAVLGTEQWEEVITDMDRKIGVPVFEIPTFPVSVPGLRLQETFARQLSLKGVRRFPQNRILEVNREKNGDFMLGIGNQVLQHIVRAKGIILASGRFWGRGLLADRKGVRETIFNLPVIQPETRREWHREDFLDGRGHPINRAGLETDASFRPLNNSGKPAFENLFASGSILAHQDWMRMKCGSGLAIASAYAAVNAFVGKDEGLGGGATGGQYV